MYLTEGCWINENALWRKGIKLIKTTTKYSIQPIYEVCPKSIRVSFISERQNVQGDLCGARVWPVIPYEHLGQKGQINEFASVFLQTRSYARNIKMMQKAFEDEYIDKTDIEE